MPRRDAPRSWSVPRKRCAPFLSRRRRCTRIGESRGGAGAYDAELSSTIADLTVSRDAAAARAITPSGLAISSLPESRRSKAPQGRHARTSDLESELANRAPLRPSHASNRHRAPALRGSGAALQERSSACAPARTAALPTGKPMEREAWPRCRGADRPLQRGLLESDARADALRTEARRDSERIGSRAGIAALRSAANREHAKIEAEVAEKLQAGSAM